LSAQPIAAGARRAERSRAIRAGPALVAGAALAVALGASPARSQTFRMVPSMEVTGSWSDNVDPTNGQPPQSSWLTELIPGIRIDLAGARVKALVDARLNYLDYARAAHLDRTERYLNSFVKVEAVENWLFLDVRANIDQENRSAFGAPATPGASVANRNRVEATTYQAAPYIRGLISDVAAYQLRFNETSVHANDPLTPDTRMSEWAGRLTSPLAKIGWTLDARGVNVRNGLVGSLDDSRVRGSLSYAFDSDIRVSLSEGYEATDFAGPPRRTGQTPGAGLEWSPGPRTQFSGVYEKRFFGAGHSVLFTHRTPLTAWRLASTKDATVLPEQLAANGPFSIEGLMSDLLTSAIRDPVERAQAVRRRLEETGIGGTSVLGSDVLTTRPFVVRETTASFAMLGAINTMALTATSKEQRNFGDAISLPALVGDEDFRQAGFDANLAHKLTPLTVLTLTATSWRTQSLVVAARRSRQQVYTLFITTQLSPRTSASLGFRRTDFVGTADLQSYRENVVFGTVTIRM